MVYIFAAGIIDDIDACVSQLARALNLPVSITIVQIRPDSPEIDVSRLLSKCEWLLQKANRNFLQVVKWKDITRMNLALQRLTKDLPF